MSETEEGAIEEETEAEEAIEGINEPPPPKKKKAEEKAAKIATRLLKLNSRFMHY